MPHHWLVLALIAHPSRPVSHGEPISVCAYFDEAPDDDSDLQTQGRQVVVPTERTHWLATPGPARIWLPISAEEYAAGSYDLYTWIEPYAAGALAVPGSNDGLALGRLKLGRGQESYRGPVSGVGLPHPGAADDDLAILHRLQLADSVVQFIVNEMNTNAAQPDVTGNAADLARARRDLEEAGNWFTRWHYSEALEGETRQAENALGHRTHKNEGWQGFLQDVYFLGGGEWDHKPVIRPVWGALNRLGNRHAVYFYDGWSNIHFGFIAARMGLPVRNALAGAGQAQGLDNAGGGAASATETGDDPADAQAIIAGHNLGLRGGNVSRQDVLGILAAHPGWIGRE